MSTLQQSLVHSSSICLISHCLLVKSYMYERHSIQLEQSEYSKNNQNTASRMCEKEENYTFSMCITRSENYSSWEPKSFEQFKTFVLACRSDMDEKYTIRIDRNWLE